MNTPRVYRGQSRPPERGRDVLNSAQPISVAGTPFQQVFEQGFRIADASLEVYELYVGHGTAPDFVTPVTTSPTLPFNWTPDLDSSGDGEFHLVCRKRNRYGLQSFNVFETVLTFVSGVQVDQPPSLPQDVRVYDDVLGYIRVVSKYNSVADPAPADTWLIYLTIGSDPNPLVDVPVYSGPMSFVGIESGLAQMLGPYTPGTVAHVIVAVKRVSDGVKTVVPVVLHTLAASLDLTEGFMFGGTTFEQH